MPYSHLAPQVEEFLRLLVNISLARVQRPVLFLGPTIPQKSLKNTKSFSGSDEHCDYLPFQPGAVLGPGPARLLLGLCRNALHYQLHRRLVFDCKPETSRLLHIL